MRPRVPFSVFCASATVLAVSLFASSLAAAEEAVLSAADPESQINIRAEPTTNSSLLHYGYSGDSVSVLDQKKVDAYTWYYVQFEQSGAKGWVRGDLLALASDLGESGVIRGELSFPSDFLPGQKVCAENIDTNEVACLETKQSQQRYSLKVKSGRYYVYAQACEQSYRTDIVCRDSYLRRKAFYNTYVQCGLTAQCQRTSSREPIVVTVGAGKVVSGINPQDWYSR